MRKEIWIAPAVFSADRICKVLAERIPQEGMVLIPGILGRDMERQHILPTLLALAVVTLATYFVTMLLR